LGSRWRRIQPPGTAPLIHLQSVNRSLSGYQAVAAAKQLFDADA
jgi:hypothetical protein